MYINKSSKGYGYFSTVKSKNKNGEEVTGYLNVNFKQGTEPEEESIKGELYFMGENGEKRKAFFNAFKKNDGSTAVGLFLLGPEGTGSVPMGFKVEEIKPDDLPFY
jgi:hypothetical protein